jgi:hypothetical protein
VRAKDPLRGFIEATEPEPEGPKVRKPSPPSASELARETARANQPDARQQVLDKLSRMADILTELATMETAPPTRGVPQPPPPPIPPGAPPPPTLKWNERTKQWEIPCTLTREQLRST